MNAIEIHEELAQWKIPNIYKADAQKVYAEIKSLGDDVSAEMILAYAKNEDTELHKCFDWDDTTAAEKWRLHQARHIVRMLVVRETPAENKEPMTIRLLFKTDNETHYQQTVKILRNEDEYAKLLERAWNELRAFKSKYATLHELDKIFELIK